MLWEIFWGALHVFRSKIGDVENTLHIRHIFESPWPQGCSWRDYARMVICFWKGNVNSTLILVCKLCNRNYYDELLYIIKASVFRNNHFLLLWFFGPILNSIYFWIDDKFCCVVGLWFLGKTSIVRYTTYPVICDLMTTKMNCCSSTG